MNTDISATCIVPEGTIRQAIAHIDSNGKGIVLVVDQSSRLIDTVTDGDIRRAILAGIDIDLPVSALLDKKHASTARPKPLTAPVDTSDADLLHMMNENALYHIPLVDREGRVMDVVLLKDLVEEHELQMSAVIMAGGYGTRLYPLTENIPKPMLPVGDRPVLERIIEQLREAGIERVNLATHYKKEVIAEHFGDGRDFGVEIQYFEEDQPLGTAGALCQLEAQDDPLLVINGDIISQIDFRAMLGFHKDHEADMTVAVRQYKLTVPYGVVEFDGVRISGLSEKPMVSHFVNAGVYLLNPELCRSIPENQAYDMTDLINQLVVENKRVIGFPVHEYWLDIGQPADYELAKARAKDGED